MRKFTKILENLSEQKFFEITAEVKLLVKSENEGEAGYLADSILGGIEEQSDFIVQNISEISEEEFKKQFESIGIGFDNKIEDDSDEQKIIKTWEAEFAKRNPTTSEKMEFYHQMRNAGYDGILIMNALKDKISQSWLKNQITESLSKSWKEVSGKLEKTFQFKNFKEALDFINKVGKISESMNHHPEITNIYNKVTLKLKTHDKDSITELDHQMRKK
jgi:4a-hydroxytetrahydrobiopterin dehydratase